MLQRKQRELLTKQGLRKRPMFQSNYGKLTEELELKSWIPPFSRLSIYHPYSNFWPIFNASFAKFLQDRLLEATNPTIQSYFYLTQITKNFVNSNTTLFDPRFQAFFSSPPALYNAAVLKEAVREDALTFSPYPKSKRLE